MIKKYILIYRMKNLSAETKYRQRQSRCTVINNRVIPNAFLPLVKIKPIITYANNQRYLDTKKQALLRHQMTVQTQKHYHQQYEKMNRKGIKTTKNSSRRNKQLPTPTFTCSPQTKDSKKFSVSIKYLGREDGTNNERKMGNLCHSMLVKNTLANFKKSRSQHKNNGVNHCSIDKIKMSTQPSNNEASSQNYEEPWSTAQKQIYKKYSTINDEDFSLNINFKQITNEQIEKAVLRNKVLRIEQLTKQKKNKQMNKIMQQNIKANHNHLIRNKNNITSTISDCKTKNNASYIHHTLCHQQILKNHGNIQKNQQSLSKQELTTQSIYQLQKNSHKLVSPYLARTIKKKHRFHTYNNHEEQTLQQTYCSKNQLSILAQLQRQGQYRVQRYGRVQKNKKDRELIKKEKDGNRVNKKLNNGQRIKINVNVNVNIDVSPWEKEPTQRDDCQYEVYLEGSEEDEG